MSKPTKSSHQDGNLPAILAKAAMESTAEVAVGLPGRTIVPAGNIPTYPNMESR